MSGRALVFLHGLGGSPDEWADAARALRARGHEVASAQPNRRIVLVGHSFGGVQALRMAAARPGRIDAVVVTGCFFPPARDGRSHALAALDYAGHRVRYLRDVAGRTRAPRPTLADARRLGSLARLGLRPRAFHAAAAAVACPVLVVHGDGDHVVPVSFARAAARAHPAWLLHEIPGGGHVVHRDRPTEWAAVVANWLDAR